MSLNAAAAIGFRFSGLHSQTKYFSAGTVTRRIPGRPLHSATRFRWRRRSSTVMDTPGIPIFSSSAALSAFASPEVLTPSIHASKSDVSSIMRPNKLPRFTVNVGYFSFNSSSRALKKTTESGLTPARRIRLPSSESSLGAIKPLTLIDGSTARGFKTSRSTWISASFVIGLFSSSYLLSVICLQDKSPTAGSTNPALKNVLRDALCFIRPPADIS